MKPDAKTKRTMLIAAAVLLTAAIVWLIALECTSYTRSLCRRINAFGYRLSPSDLYSKGYGDGVSIASVIGEETDLSEAVRCSTKCGFSSDVDRTGRVELMLCDIDDTHIMIIWLVDRSPELVFIEDRTSGEVSPIG